MSESVGSVGESSDNAKAEFLNGIYEVEFKRLGGTAKQNRVH